MDESGARVRNWSPGKRQGPLLREVSDADPGLARGFSTTKGNSRHEFSRRETTFQSPGGAESGILHRHWRWSSVLASKLLEALGIFAP